MSVITWYGHSNFKIECNGINVIIDPFFAPSSGMTLKDAGKIDLVLLTHDHGDHVGDTIQISKKGAIVGAIVGTADALVKRGAPENSIYNGIGFNIGGTLKYKGIEATMTQAFHSSDTGEPAGYIVHMPDGLTIYHAGDTGIFSSMQELGKLYPIDVALLPIGGTFTMDGYQAANACKLLGCKSVIPMHWGTFPVLAQSPDEFHKKLNEICPECRFISIQIGESMEFQN